MRGGGAGRELRKVRAVDDWILRTLPPPFAIMAKAEPVAVVLNMTGGRFGRNRKIKAIQAHCGERFASGPRKTDTEKASLA